MQIKYLKLTHGIRLISDIKGEDMYNMHKKWIWDEIMGAYNYSYTESHDGSITVLNRSPQINNGEDIHYKNLTEALKDWLSTMEASNETHLKEEGEEYYLWSKEEIEFVRNLY